VIQDYLRRLRVDLESRGVVGRGRARVLAEVEDHLHELAADHGEEEAVRRFGESRPFAIEVAAQLATTRAIRSTYATFAALTLTAVGYVVFLGSAGREDLFAGKHAAIGFLASVALGLFPQIALVAGGLALLRALRRRGQGALSCHELDVMGRRSAVAVVAGFLTVASMVVWALEYGQLTPVLLLGIAPALPLGIVFAALVRASGTQAVSTGPAEDLFDDLHLERLRQHAWLFALVVASAAALAALAVEGPILAGLEFNAVLTGYVLLGRPLALRN
jgi:hypothetical protein